MSAPAASMARWPKNWLPSRGDCRRGESLPFEKTTCGPEGLVEQPVLAREGLGGQRSGDELPERVEVGERRALG